jgi:acyl carrier protein
MVASEWIDRVRSLLADAFELPVDEIPPDLEFGGIKKWDSMGHMEVMLRLEAQFGIELDTDLIRQLTGIPAIVAYLEERENDQHT